MIRTTEVQSLPDLEFSILSISAAPYALLPRLLFELKIVNKIAEEKVYSVLLSAEVIVNVPATGKKRTTDLTEPLGIEAISGVTGESSRRLYLGSASNIIPQFTGETTSVLSLPFLYDVESEFAKYVTSIDKGNFYFILAFAGNAIYQSPGGPLYFWPIPKEKEAEFKLPIDAWRKIISEMYGQAIFVRVTTDTIESIKKYQEETGLPTLNDAIKRLAQEHH